MLRKRKIISIIGYAVVDIIVAALNEENNYKGGINMDLKQIL